MTEEDQDREAWESEMREYYEQYDQAEEEYRYKQEMEREKKEKEQKEKNKKRIDK